MRFYLFTFMFLIFLNFQAQERKPLNGIVLGFDKPLENVHVKNVTTGKYALSNDKGEFSVLSHKKDTLLITHVSMMDMVKFLSEADVAQDPLIINMVNLSNELKEITITQNSEINAVSEGIIPRKIEKLTVNERRLKAAGDFKYIHLLSILGGGLQIDPILNAINGRTKKLKKNLVIEKKIENVGILEGYRDYMTEDMGLNEEELTRLISFCAEEGNLQNVINSKNEGIIHLFLIESWDKYLSLQQ